MLVIIEGIDGSGKGTQAAALMRKLSKEKVDAHLFSFPQYQITSFGTLIGEYLNGDFGSAVHVHPKLASLLYACDRFEAKAELEAQLSVRDVVVCDRYVSSNLAHQAAKLNEEEGLKLCKWLDRVEYDIFKLPVPDITLQLDMPVSLAMQLIVKKQGRSYTSRRTDDHESDVGYLTKVRDWYNQLSSITRGDRWTRIMVSDEKDALRSIEDVSAEIWNIVSAYR